LSISRRLGNQMAHGRMIVIGGPTASGKSALALAFAEQFDGVVINADSMQVYRALTILTARPGPAAQARVPHALYGMLEAEESCSAGRWAELASAEIAAARSAAKLPIVVGGTGLYLRALLSGLAAIPPIPPTLREAVRQLALEGGAAALRARLEASDPVMAARLRPGDTQRLARALEVIEATGRSMAAWQADAKAATGPAAPLHIVILEPSRAALRAACDARFESMIAAGAIAEVAALQARSLSPAAPILKALGVRELSAHLAGQRSLPEAVAAAKAASRRYAKRQQTWFRHQLPGAHHVPALYEPALFPTLAAQAADSLGIDRIRAAD
jgi:tRNA dimethylallyltransferase